MAQNSEIAQAQWLEVPTQSGLGLENIWVGDSSGASQPDSLLDSFYQYRQNARVYPLSDTAFDRFPNTFNTLRRVLRQRINSGHHKLSVLTCPSSAGLEALTLIANALEVGYSLKDIEVVAIDRDPAVLQYMGNAPFWAKLDNSRGDDSSDDDNIRGMHPVELSSLTIGFPIARVGAHYRETSFDLQTPPVTQLARVAYFPQSGLVGDEGTYNFPVTAKREVVEAILPICGDVGTIGDCLGEPRSFDVIVYTNLRPVDKDANGSVVQQADDLLNCGGFFICQPNKEEGFEALDAPQSPFIPVLANVLEPSIFQFIG